MFFDRTTRLFCGGLALLVLVSCATEQKHVDYRIVSLSPAMTEVVFSLGAGDKIVGVTTYCDFPEQAKEITKVGDFSHPSIERIVALKPDLVIVNLPEQKRTQRELEKLGINIFVSSPTSLADIYQELAQIGKTLGQKRQADSLIEYMKHNLQNITKEDAKRVFVEISPRPIITIGAVTFLNDIIERAGGTNIFKDLEKDYPVVNQEAVIMRDPEIIIVLHPEDIAGRTGWQRIQAIKNNRVYTDLNPDLLMRPGPRLVDGFRQLKRIIND